MSVHITVRTAQAGEARVKPGRAGATVPAPGRAGTAAPVLAIAVMAGYFRFSLPRIRLIADRLAPHSRRARAILIGDEIFTKVGGYILGTFLTFLTSVIAGIAATALRLRPREVVLRRLDTS